MFKLRFNLQLRTQLEFALLFTLGMALSWAINARMPGLGEPLVMVTVAAVYLFLIVRFVNTSRRGIARHEAAHVVAAWVLPGHPTVREVQLDWTGGATHYEIDPDGPLPTEREARAVIVSSLAGIAADERNYGRPGPGCDTDLFAAEWMARRYLHTGPLGFDAAMEDALRSSRILVNDRWDDVVRLGDELLDAGKLDRTRITMILGPKRPTD